MTDLPNLVMQLEKYSEAYYNDQPIITDIEYDQLVDKLRKLDPTNPFLSRVGAAPASNNPKIKHKSFMGSLSKVTSREEFLKWCPVETLLAITPKFDGSTIVATYINGNLTTLATRGDGYEGEDITHNASKINNIAFSLGDFTGDLRGEVMLRLSLFEKHFKPLGYKNPRNAANGKARDQKNDPLVSYLEVFWFDVIPEDREFSNEREKWGFLLNNGLLENSRLPYLLFPHNVWTLFEEYNSKLRSELDYEIDGLVAKVNDTTLQTSLGVSSGRPKGAVAIKFPSVQGKTLLKDVVWTRGLTGRIGPVGILEPLELGGVTIKKVSLCNPDEIERLGVAIGDKVLVSRRNDVIPKIEQLAEKGDRRTHISPPTNCKDCQRELIRDSVWFICPNLDCQGQVYGNLMTWLKVLKMRGIGPNILRGIIDQGITDICQLHQASEELFIKASNSEKIGHKIYTALQDVKELRLGLFLTGLNIDSLGKTAGSRIEKHFKTLSAVQNASIEQLQEVDGIKTKAKLIRKGLDDKSDLITQISKVIKIVDLDSAGPLAGISVCITGELSKPRPVIADWIRSLGGEMKSGVSKKLDYLVTNNPDSGTTKNKKADQYGITKLTEEEFYQTIGKRPQ